MLLSQCVQVQPEDNPNICIIWLHGLGANGHDFEPIIPHLKIDRTIRPWFVFPNAPTIKVTVNNFMPMPAWYDILELNINREVDKKGIFRSIKAIQKLINQIEKIVPSDHILLAGFSQGGVIAYGTAISYASKLAGVIGLSTYLPNTLELDHHPANQETEILICHGKYDEVVPRTLGIEARDYFEAKGHKVKYTEYEMQHQVILPQCEQIGKWINTIFSDLDLK